MFKTQYSKHERCFAPAGDRIRAKYELVIDPDGNRHLEESGVEDQYERIQSFKDGCTIENIVRRALNGDPNALSRAQGVYCDTTLLPNDLIAADEAIRRAEAIYKALPADQRSKFGSFRDFISNFGSLEKIQAFLHPEKEAPAAAAPAAAAPAAAAPAAAAPAAAAPAAAAPVNTSAGGEGNAS